MRKQDYLVHLIHSLSPSEKRYFTLFCQGQKGGDKYLKMFNQLEKTTSYNSTELAKALKLKPENLAHDKEQLEEVLLRNMRAYHEDNFADSKAMTEYLSADLLYKKGMGPYAISIATKALEKAMLHERFGLALSITRLLSHSYNNTGKYDEVQRINQQESILAEAMSEYLQMIHLRDRFMSAIHTRKGYDELKDVAKHPLFTRKPAQLKSFMAKHCQSEIGVFYYQYVMPNPDKALECAKLQLDLFKQQPHFRAVIPTAYYNAYSKLVVRYYGIGNYKQALVYANAMLAATEKPVKGTPPAVALRYNTFGKGIKMTLLSLLHLFAEARAFGKQAYAEAEGLQIGDRLTFLLDYSLALFHTGDYNNCHTELNKLIDINTKDRIDIQLYGRLLFIMLQLQVKNYSIIPYQVKNVRSWIKRSKANADGVAEVLSWLEKLGKAGAKGEYKDAFNSFKQALQQEALKGISTELALDKWGIPARGK